MASRIARIAFLSVLLLVSTHTAWAARGDFDPSYGGAGSLALSLGVVLPLPGDRLLVADGGTDFGFRVRMVDATGHNVQSFGSGGVVQISSAAWAGFARGYAALAPNGDIFLAGDFFKQVAPGEYMWVPALLRLDMNGQPVSSFGNSGDGFLEPAATISHVKGFAVDPNGKLVVAGPTFDSNNYCVSPARLLRLLANGQPDTGFGFSGDGVTKIPNLDLCNGVSVFGVRADGTIVVGDSHTIVSVDASGSIDTAFGTMGNLGVGAGTLTWSKGSLLSDGGLLILASTDESAATNDTEFFKFDRNGQPDPTFGAGTGTVTVDLGGRLLGANSAHEHLDQLALEPDGMHLAAQLSFTGADGSPVCMGIARLAIDGTPDAGFGHNGLTCLDINFNLTAVQSNGAPLFDEGYYSAIHRLLPDNKPSQGFLRVVSTDVRVDESRGRADVIIERLAGRDGAVSASYTTVDRQGKIVCYGCSSGYRPAPLASAGSDYVAVSGRLDWASGDVSQHTVTLEILDDATLETTETFGVDFTDPGGGTFLYSDHPTVYILDNDQAPPPPPPPPPASDSGGGGSFSWAALLALLTQLLLRRRRIKPGRVGLGGLLQE